MGYKPCMPAHRIPGGGAITPVPESLALRIQGLLGLTGVLSNSTIRMSYSGALWVTVAVCIRLNVTAIHQVDRWEICEWYYKEFHFAQSLPSTFGHLRAENDSKRWISDKYIHTT
jgi:hypothetical protein